MNILAIDPGPEESGFVVYDTDGKRVLRCGSQKNCDAMLMIGAPNRIFDEIACEMVACMGMTVGAEVFETCVWIGRFWQSSHLPFHRLKRQQVKMHLCHTMRAKDANIRQSLIDKFGPGKDKAIGNKKAPGPLYGISGHCWSALAIAVTFAETFNAT